MTTLLLLALVGVGAWLALRHTLRVDHKNKTDGYATVERIPNGVGMKYSLETEGTLGLSAPQLKQGIGGFKQLYPGVKFDIIDSDSYGLFVEVLPKTEKRRTYYSGGRFHGDLAAKENPSSPLRIFQQPSGGLQAGIVRISHNMGSEEIVAAIKDAANKAQQRYEEDTANGRDRTSLIQRTKSAIQQAIH